MNAITPGFPLPDTAAIDDLRRQIWANGFRPVEVCGPDKGGKRPARKAWPTLARQTPPDAAIAGAKLWAPNTGVLGDGLRIVDIDHDDPTTAGQLESLAIETFGPTITRRRANSPRSLLVYRAAEGAPGRRGASAPEGGAVEILGFGHQCVAYGWHATGAELVWPDGGPGDVNRDTLPAVTEAQVEAYLTAAAVLLGEGAVVSVAVVQAEATPGHNPIGDINDLSDAIDALPNARPKNWHDLNLTGMQLFAGSGGSEAGRALFHQWSEKHPLHDPIRVDRMWDHYHTPGGKPTQTGAGPLFKRVAREVPGWMKPSSYPTHGAEFTVLPPEMRAGITATPFAWVEPYDVEPRHWIYGRHYIRKYLSATVAPGGIGKSSHAIVEALDMVTGLGLLTGKRTDEKFRVWYWNGEDPIDETVRRVVAACKHYGITEADIGGRLFLDSGRDVAITIATESRDGLQIAKPTVDALTAELQANAIDVLILDPFVTTHRVSENDNSKINAVAEQFKAIADRANVAVELIHHLRKASGHGEDRVAEDARGGGALIASTRSLRVINPMQVKEAASLGIEESTRRRIFRVDDGKVNLQPPGERTAWRYLASVDLGNQRAKLAADHVGVATVWKRPGVGDNVTPAQTTEIVRRLAAGGLNRYYNSANDWVGRDVAAVLDLDLADKPSTGRVVAIIDHMIAAGALDKVRTVNGKGRPTDIVAPGRMAADVPSADLAS